MAAPAPEHLTSGSDHLDRLKNTLATGKSEDADELWSHYSALDEQSRNSHLSKVILFLSETGRATDSWKILELFQKLDPNQWNGPSVYAKIHAELNLSNLDNALEIFNKGLGKSDVENVYLVDAFDLLLSTALTTSDVDLLKRIWENYDGMTARWKFDGITSQLKHVSSVPDLAVKVIERRSFLQDLRETWVRPLQKLLVRRALPSCADNYVLPLLRLTDDHLAYEEFIRGASKSRKNLLIEVYKVYRELPNSKPGHGVLHCVFNAYTALSSAKAKFAGLESLWGDWHTFDIQPSQRAYQRFMAFYASKGDKAKVFGMWKDYTRLYADLGIFESVETFAHLLQVHAVRGELVEARRIFDEISTRFRLDPNRHCWNILLNAHVKSGDYEGAITTFERLSQAVGADQYTYGTLMQMAADRGDLGYTVDLYRRARRQELATNDVPILSSLIDAYCHNGLFREAEDICISAARRGLKDPRMWNRLIHVYAHQHNLTSINCMLSLMTDMDVSYNQYTYHQLLLGLALCRQAQHALHLLTVAIQDNVFEVHEEHFHLVMGAFIKTGETDMAVRVHKLMQQCGFDASADSLLALATAFGQWSRSPRGSKRGHSQETLLRAALSRFYKEYGISKANVPHGMGKSSESPQPVSAEKLLRSNKAAQQFSRMAYLFAQMGDYMKVEELIKMYRYVAHGTTDASHPLPIKMLNSLLGAQFHEKRYDAARETWNLMVSMAKEGSLSVDWSEDLPHTRKVSPRYRYVLSDGLKIMQQAYVEQGDLAGLRKVVEQVRADGFEIDSKNWNLYIQSLVKLKAYQDAFAVCETWLMPGWTGWKRARAKEPMKNAIPLDLRRKGASQYHLRPVSLTLYYLARGYMELDSMGPFSAEAGRVLRDVQRLYPRCNRAVLSMVRDGNPAERTILGETDMPPYDAAEVDGLSEDEEAVSS